MSHDDRVAKILAEMLEAQERGESVDQARILRDYPDLALELESRLLAAGFVKDGFAEIRADDTPPCPKEIGDYDIVREIGRGGMGVVYEAEQKRMKRRVALKVLTASITSTPQAVRRFQREARAAGRLHHTNIVPVYDLDQYAGQWYYAMELVVGRSLSDVVTDLRGRRPTETRLAQAAVDETPDSTDVLSGTGTDQRSYHLRVAELFAGVADALELAHQEGIVHRDVKPSNLLLDADGVLKVVDFGLARFEDEALGMTMTGDLLGTPQYMSPEQAMAKRMGIDHRTDIYSLGATLYEVLTLAPPFDARSLQELCSQIITKDPALPRKRNPRIPKDLETIVCKAIEKDRDKRYQTARDFARDLRAFADGAAIHAKRIGPAGRVWRRVKRHKVRSALVAAVLLSAVVGGIFAVQAMAQAERDRARRYDETWTEAFAAYLRRGPSAGLALDLGMSPQVLLDEAVELQPDRFEAYVARALLVTRTIDERLADIEAARARGLSAHTWHLARAYVLQQHGRWTEAKLEEKQVGATTPRAPVDRLVEAALAWNRKDFAAAEGATDAIIEETSERSPLRFLAHRYRSAARSGRRDYEGALADALAFTAAGDRTPMSRLWVAVLWDKLGHEDRAQGLVDALLDDIADADTAAWVQLAYAAQHGNLSWNDRVTEAFLRAHPQHHLALLARAHSLKRQGRASEGLPLLDHAAVLAPDSHVVHSARSQLLQGVGRYGDALSAVEQAMRLHTADQKCANCAVQRSQCLEMLGRFDEAVREAVRGLELSPFHAALHACRGRALLRTKRAEEALTAFTRAVECSPHSALSRHGRGRALTDLSRYEQALAEFDRVLEFDPDPRLAARAHASRGYCLRRLDKNDDAITAFRRALELNPEYAWAHARLGEALAWATDDFEAALAALDQAIELDPSLSDAHANRALVLEWQKKYDAALAANDQAIALDPEQAVPHANRGNVLWALGRRKEALAAFDESVKLGATSVTYRRRGRLFRELGRHEEALADFDRALAAKRDPFTVKLRGVTLGALNRWEEALAAFDEYAQAHPDDAENHANRAVALSRTGHDADAVAAIERAHALGHRQWNSYYLLAWLLATSADPDTRDAKRAERAARQAIQLNPAGACYTALGAALYRAGKHKEALRALEQGMRLHKGGSAYEWFLVAMASHRLGGKRARTWFDKAVAWMEKHKPDDPELKRFRAEAVRVLGGATE